MEQELGPFGRSFLTDEFPSSGTLAMLIIGELTTFMLFGWFLGCFLSIFTAFLVGYLCYNIIEPHFNTREGSRDFLNDFDVIPSGLNDKMKKAYRNSGMVEIWDFTGNQISHIFERSHGGSETDLTKSSTGKVWVKVWIIWIAVYISLYVVGIGGLIVALVANVGNIDLFFQVVGIATYLVMFSIFLMAIFLEDAFEYFTGLFRKPNLKRATFLVILVSIIDFVASIVYSILYDFTIGVPAEDSWFIEASSGGDPMVLFLLFVNLVICAPIFEELIFRGYILDSLRGVHSDLIAILSSGLMFGMMHYSILGPFFPVGATAIGGILYAWLRIKTGSIWPSIVCHSLWNGTIFFVEFVL